jgi:anti-anti-sigma factor
LVVEKLENTWILGLRGEHDLATCQTLEAELEAVFAHGTKVVIDLNDSTFIDSSIIGCIYRGYEAAHEKAEDALVVVAPPGSMPRRLLATVKLDTVIPTYDDMDAALNALA